MMYPAIHRLGVRCLGVFPRKFTNRTSFRSYGESVTRYYRSTSHCYGDSKITARPPGEAEVESKFPLPDKEKEVELSRQQVGVQNAYQRGDYQQALSLSVDLLQSTSDHFSEEHPATASAYCNLGLVHKQLGNYKNAHKAYDKAAKLYESVLGTKHASYAACMHNTAMLYQTQIHLDADLSATDRWTLLEEALSMLQEALTIRVAEMGNEHPHTIATKSSLGSLLATQILHHYKVTTKGETETSASTRQQRLYTSLVEQSSQVSSDTWDAAHNFLRAALQTSIESPRGPRLSKPRKDKASKRQKKTVGVLLNQPMALDTLSSANAAQNLAIFLKTRAVVLAKSTQETSSELEPAALLEEAHSWYTQVLELRRQLLPEGHALIYATMYSLAECLESMGRLDEAQKMRQDIVDIYDPPDAEK